MGIKKYRKSLNIPFEEIIPFIKANGNSTVYYLENSYLENKLFNYLVLFRTKGVDMNTLFDEIIQKDFPKYKDCLKNIERKEPLSYEKSSLHNIEYIVKTLDALKAVFLVEELLEKENNIEKI